MIPILIDAVNWLFNIMYALLLIKVLLSWMPIFSGGRVVGFIYAVTEPVLIPIRRLVERSPLGGPGMMLDFSPIIAFLLLNVLRDFVGNMLRMAL